MGFKLLSIEDDDEEVFDILPITSPERWTPYKFHKKNNDNNPYDPTDLDPKQEVGYPAMLNHTSTKVDADLGGMLL